MIKLGYDCLERVWPDVTILLDIDPAAAAGRIDRQLDRMEMKPGRYHLDVRAGFKKLADMHGDKVKTVDATGSIEQVHKQVIKIIETIS